MSGNAKTRRLDCRTTAAVDRISNLPRDLIDLILERLPIHDAARTSILSKTWRDVWGLHPNLVFDEVFFSKLVSDKDEQAQLLEVSRTISDILLINRDPILKFHLSIPKDLPLQQCLHMDLWIKKISNNGVRKLELFNSPPVAYKMPSYLFSCLELTELTLNNCILNPPFRFGGFCNLICVQLTDVIITADMSFGTKLKQLTLGGCSGIEHLGCQFKNYNNLTELFIYYSGETDSRWFECTTEVKSFCLALKGVENPRVKNINLGKLLGNMLRINCLIFDGSFLKCLEPGAYILKKLKTTRNLKSLYLCRVRFYELVQIKYVLCLMRSSPNLHHLQIDMKHKVRSKNDMDLAASREHMVLSVVHYLQLPNFADMILDQLQIVNIYGMGGSRAELQFLKLLLASSPSLKWIKIMSTAVDDPKEESRISRELMRFPRASTAAQIIWT